MGSPLKLGQNGTKSINKQLNALDSRADTLEAAVILKAADSTAVTALLVTANVGKFVYNIADNQLRYISGVGTSVLINA